MLFKEIVTGYTEIPTNQVHKYTLVKNADFLDVTASGSYI